jgi:hypothetical protein
MKTCPVCQAEVIAHKKGQVTVTLLTGETVDLSIWLEKQENEKQIEENVNEKKPLLFLLSNLLASLTILHVSFKQNKKDKGLPENIGCSGEYFWMNTVNGPSIIFKTPLEVCGFSAINIPSFGPEYYNNSGWHIGYLEKLNSNIQLPAHQSTTNIS